MRYFVNFSSYFSINLSRLNRRSSFAKSHIIYPLLMLILATVIIEIAAIDRRVADYLYLIQGSQWSLKDAWVTSVALHKGGRLFSIALLLVVIALLTSTFFIPRLKPWRRTLGYVVFAAGGSCLLVSLIKEISNISCPWEFTRYGGSHLYISLLSELSERTGKRCFPAGHASGGYAWIALYFAGCYWRLSWRWLGLAFALLLGLIFGFTQQLRGAHFISHDIWSLAVCWFFSLFIYHFWLQKNSVSISIDYERSMASRGKASC